MATTVQELDRRMTSLETYCWELPTLINSRNDRFESEFSDLRNRLQHLDRSMSAMQMDMRDLRGGVTRQLIAQDQVIQELKADVTIIKADVGTLKADVGTLKAGIAELLSRTPRT
jgi:prefoldin subunit 5